MSLPRDLKTVSVLWAGVDHAEDLAGCHRTLFTEGWDKAAFEGLLSHPTSTSLIARHGNPQETIGFIKDWQRQGVGRRLIEGMARAAKRAEAKRMFLEVAGDNLPALVLYSRMGFKEVGRRAGYYVRSGQPAVDALILSLAL
jgi:[ribosomal protein S18]-alanine N-acetyltransferase